MRRFLTAFFVAIFASTFFAVAKDVEEPKPAVDARPLVQIAILLDTSGSMDGLINQARTQLWKIVNEFARAKREGKTPLLEVALFEYGNSGQPVAQGYIRQIAPLTDDLDTISEKLFALTTNGGEEYCGQVISVALADLKWNSDPKTFKAIFIAGNEPFTQGTVDYKESCSKAIGKGVIVNTIHCGPAAQGVSGMWTDGARLGEGKAMNIDQDHAIVAIRTPQDDEITKLSVELNKTYVPYGGAGAGGAARQSMQDQNAAADASSGGYVQRSVSKAQSTYSNSSWDLVDAVERDGKKLESIEAKDLPEPMRAMTLEQRAQYLKDRQTERAEIQKKINTLNLDREKLVAEKEREAAKSPSTFDTAVLEAIHDQLSQRGYDVGKK